MHKKQSLPPAKITNKNTDKQRRRFSITKTKKRWPIILSLDINQRQQISSKSETQTLDYHCPGSVLITVTDTSRVSLHKISHPGDLYTTLSHEPFFSCHPVSGTRCSNLSWDSFAGWTCTYITSSETDDQTCRELSDDLQLCTKERVFSPLPFFSVSFSLRHEWCKL